MLELCDERAASQQCASVQEVVLVSCNFNSGDAHMTGSNRKTVIVTGASSGIGQSIASHLAQNGWRVFGTMRRPDLDRHGPDALQLDVTSGRHLTEES
jgi:hypothetical protein